METSAVANMLQNGTAFTLKVIGLQSQFVLHFS